METACYQYAFSKALDPKKLDKVGQLKRVGKLGVWEAKYGDLVVHVFQSGEMRAFVPGEAAEKLQPVLLSGGVKLIELLQAIKKAGHAVDEQEVLSSGQKMAFTYLSPEGIRPSFDGVSVDLLREVSFAPFEIAQAFQLERNFMQAGENAGRRLEKELAPKNMKELNAALAGFLKGQGIGLASFTEAPEPRSTYPAQVMALEESAFAAGMPMINKPYCHFVRGLLRGAYVAFYELENIDVKEEECWGLGNDHCVFRAVVFPK